MTAAAGTQPAPLPLDAPYERLAELPRALWLPALITSAGEREARLVGTGRWLASLQAGELPPDDADFGDPLAAAPLRGMVGELGLPRLARGVPALAQQVLRTMLWHLDRINNLQPRLGRADAIATVAQAFRAEWQLETQGLDEDLKLLLTLGDATTLQWGLLRGALRSRPWQEVQRAAQRLASLPELAALIQRLGRSERKVSAPPSAATAPDAGPAPPLPLKAVRTVLPDTVACSTSVDLITPGAETLNMRPRASAMRTPRAIAMSFLAAFFSQKLTSPCAGRAWLRATPSSATTLSSATPCA